MNRLDINDNERKILLLLLENDSLSRADLSRLTSLNKSTTSYISKKLLDLNIISELEVKKLTNGRSATKLCINQNYVNHLIIDLTPDKPKFFVTDFLGFILCEFSFNSFDFKDVENSIYLNTLNVLNDELYNIKSIAISIHGAVNSYTNEVNSPFYDFDLTTFNNLINKYDVTTTLYNESNIYAAGIFKSSKIQRTNILNIHINSGVGMGIIVNNHLFQGSMGKSGELGHIIVQPHGRLCACGNLGCLEQYISQSVVNKKIELILNKKVSQQTNLKSDQKLDELYHEVVMYISQTLNNLIALYDPDKINICCDYLCGIQTLDLDIKNNLRCNILNTPPIVVTKYNDEVFTQGFCNLIISDMLKLRLFKNKSSI